MKPPLYDRLFMAAILLIFLWSFVGGVLTWLNPAVLPVYRYGLFVIVGLLVPVLVAAILIIYIRAILGRDA